MRVLFLSKSPLDSRAQIHILKSLLISTARFRARIENLTISRLYAQLNRVSTVQVVCHGADCIIQRREQGQKVLVENGSSKLAGYNADTR